MFERISRGIITFVGALAGFAVGRYGLSWLASRELLNLPSQYITIGIIAVIMIIFGIAAWFVSKPITRGIIRIGGRIDEWQQDKSVSDIVVFYVALIAGLSIAFLFSNLTNKIPIAAVALVVNMLIYLVCVYVCVRIVWKRRSDFSFPFVKYKKRMSIPPKILDTAALTDGRIYDLCKTGFVEGCIIIPDFVADELKQMEESADELRASRGRRGLTIIADLQEKLKLPVAIMNTDTDSIDDSSSRILRFALAQGGSVITTDYALSRAAQVQRISVININELTNAIKTAVLPGDERTVRIVREGKERAQGVAYLDDGTMIVVENGKYHVGETVKVTVTSALQTAAGRMVFADLSDNQ